MVAHTIMSWEFADGQHLAISIETRRERGEEYSALRGFFREYELYGAWDWRFLANGTIDQMLYERGRLDDSRPFDALRTASWINARALAADADPQFSRRIREPDGAGTP